MRSATSLTLLALSAGTAWAQAALDDEGKPVATTDPAASPTTLEAAAPVEYGVELRLRRVFVPNGLLELFVERAAGGAANTGFGLDLVRRRGDVELLLGIEYEKITVGEGAWVEKGTDPSRGDEVDYILGPGRGSNFGWLTLELTFAGHKKLHDKVAFRYGLGAGVGILTGELLKYDVLCGAGASNQNLEPCRPQALGGAGQDADGLPAAYKLPPAFPVVNGILGVQVRPTRKTVVNVEGGIRTVPFVGISFGYFL